MSGLHAWLEQQRALYGDTLVLDADARGLLRAALAGADAGAGERTDGKDGTDGSGLTAGSAGSGPVRRNATTGINTPPPPIATEPMAPRTSPAPPTHVTASSLDELNAKICDCMRCPLGATRTRFVFGVGNPDADIVIVGEAPGADEDRQGEPFVGRAGQLLNKILEAIDLRREDVYIANILKCRPPNNRDPLAAEVEQCEPYLHAQLGLIRPKIMLALGRIAAQTLLRTTATLGQLREGVHTYQGVPLMVTYHPAALLRNPNWKKPTWEDVQRFRATYDRIISGSKG